MKKLSAFCCVLALAGGCVCAGVAQDSKPAAADAGTQTRPDGHRAKESTEILSGTQGVDFKPYLKNALKQVYAQWLTLLPDEARAQKVKGATEIRFTINPDGTIAAMHLDGSAKDTALDGAAWGAVTGVGHFTALPNAFHGPNLELRIHFLMNDDAAVPAEDRLGS